jgi:hypothetical protein
MNEMDADTTIVLDSDISRLDNTDIGCLVANDSGSSMTHDESINSWMHKIDVTNFKQLTYDNENDNVCFYIYFNHYVTVSHQCAHLRMTITQQSRALFRWMNHFNIGNAAR